MGWIFLVDGGATPVARLQASAHLIGHVHAHGIRHGIYSALDHGRVLCVDHVAQEKKGVLTPTWKLSITVFWGAENSTSPPQLASR